MGLLDEYDLRREANDRDKENSARLAYSFATMYSTGSGTLQFADRIGFGCTFIEMPTVSYGSSVDIDDLANSMEDLLKTDVDSDDVALPLSSGYVVAWDQDDRNFYTGAWVAVRVYYPDSDGMVVGVPVEITHNFSFGGIALKDIPASDS